MSLLDDRREQLRLTGHLGTVIAKEYGGLGLDAAVANDTVADVAREDPSLAILLYQHLAVSARIGEWGTGAQCAALLPALAAGDLIAASAWSEPGADANKRGISTAAVPSPGGWSLTGAKHFVTGAGLADIYLVLTRTSDGSAELAYGNAGQTMFLVDATTPGLVAGKPLALEGMRSSSTGSLRFDGCVVSDKQILGELDGASAILARVRESGAALGAVSLGLAEAALTVALEQLLAPGRRTAPAVIAELADVAAQIEAIRGCVERAGRAPSDGRGRVVLLGKLFASETTEAVCSRLLRLVGSAGYLESHPLNALARDARAVALMGPSNEVCREVVSASWTQ
jgi:alkylation response protein AidB-like acyl-CoA dehydrogenase